MHVLIVRQVISKQEGLSEWAAAAAQLSAPSAYDWDVFISHAGNSADKPFAQALVQLLEGTQWGLRVFLDDNSLVPGGDPDRSMQDALQSAQVALLLFSSDFLKRTATMSELKLLLERHAAHRVELLPVFLRMTVKECKEKLSSLLQPGATDYSINRCWPFV